MTEAATASMFGDALRAAFSRFKLEEDLVRGKQDDALASGALQAPIDDEYLLERPTRRFLIDPMLRALGWDPDDPSRVLEEERSWTDNGDRLYFDYLGVNRRRAPSLLVEAKGADSDAPRPPRSESVTSLSMPKLISEALGALKGDKRSPVLAEWAGWLADLRSYVASFDKVDRLSLQRVVITAGRWMIIFKDPQAAFIDGGAPEPSHILCYTSFEEIVERHAEVYSLLACSRLIDTLPLTMMLSEALQVLNPSALSEAYRGVVVATQMTGGKKLEFPLRLVYPAVILLSGGRHFGVVDYTDDPPMEPRNAENLKPFLEDLAARGDAFEARLLNEFGRADLTVSSVELFPVEIGEQVAVEIHPPSQDSFAAFLAPTVMVRQLVRRTGERNAAYEFLVITGTTWFYKAVEPWGRECGFHNIKDAKKHGVARPEGRFEYVQDSFTLSDDPQNCEHGDLLGRRHHRCLIREIESNLCCRSCIYHDLCWNSGDLPRLPCAT